MGFYMELLCLWSDNVPDIRGEIYAARSDNFYWGNCECLGDFLVVHIDDAPELSEILETKDDAGLGWFIDPSCISQEEINKALLSDWYVIETSLDAVGLR